MLAELPEIINLRQAARLVKVSKGTFSSWIHAGESPMGEIKEGVHYFRQGVAYRIVTNQIAKLFGII